MNADTEKLTERDEIEMLLPFYVTGRLDEAEQERVSAYLAAHPDMQARLQLSRAERTETTHLNALAEDHPPVDADRFMDRIAATRPDPEPGGLLAWIDSMISAPFGAGMRWAGAAAIVVIMVQAAVLVTLVAPRFADDYEMAEGTTQAPSTGSFVLVRFADDARFADIAKMLADLDMTIADGPRAGALFKIRIGAQNMSETERKARTAALKAREDLVILVTPTK